MEATRKNTLKIVFGSTAKSPKHLDVLRFVGGKLGIPAESVHSIYKDENDHAFYIKFMDENEFNCFGTGLEEQYTFEYDDGTKTPVRIDIASRLFRYVRIFNLPPEIDDKEIAAVLSQFGSIRQHVRERYPADFGYSVFSGIRGVHMEISKELPANLFIGHFKVRIFYEGLKNRCFYCKNDGHLKANCPKLASAKATQIGGQYSQVLANAAIGSSASTSSTMNMTTIPVPVKSSVVPTTKPVSSDSEQGATTNSEDADVVVANPTQEIRPTGEQADIVEEMDTAASVSADRRNTLKRVPDSTSDSSESDETKQQKQNGKPKKKQAVLDSSRTVSPIDAMSGRASRSKNRSRSGTRRRH